MLINGKINAFPFWVANIFMESHLGKWSDSLQQAVLIGNMGPIKVFKGKICTIMLYIVHIGPIDK